MNHKQKLGYALLGAAVMAIGIIIGQLSTLNIEAQGNNVFDEIVCKKITVVDSYGKTGIVLESITERGNMIIINHRSGERAVRLIASQGIAIIEAHKPSGKSAARLIASKPSTSFSLHDERERSAIKLGILGEAIRSIAITDEKEAEVFHLITSPLGTHATIYDAEHQQVWRAP